MSVHHYYAMDDTIEFMGNDDDQYIRVGMTAKVIKLCDDGDNYVEGRDRDGDPNNWYIRPDGTVLDASGVGTRLVPPSEAEAKAWVTSGIKVVFHGCCNDSETSVEGRTGTVTTGPDSDDDYYVQFDEPFETDDGDTYEMLYVREDGTAGGGDTGYHVTPVTTSPVGNTTGWLQAGELVKVSSTTVNDDHGKPIHGLTASVRVVKEGQFWIEFRVSDGGLDGFYATDDGVSIDYGHELIAVPRTTDQAQRQMLALRDGQTVTVEHETDVKAKPRVMTPEPPIVRTDIEHGHIDANGTVYPTPPEMPVTLHAIKINGQVCQPVTRRIETHTYPWVETK